MTVPSGPPSVGLLGFIKGQIPRRGRMTTVEQRDGRTWRPVGRYGTSIDAKAALDEAIGSGADPAGLRVVEPRSTFILTVFGAGAIALAVAIVLYISFS